MQEPDDHRVDVGGGGGAAGGVQVGGHAWAFLVAGGTAPLGRRARSVRDANDTGMRPDRAGRDAWLYRCPSAETPARHGRRGRARARPPCSAPACSRCGRPAAAAAGPWLPLAVLLAGLSRYCNAVSAADLAVAHPDAAAVATVSRRARRGAGRVARRAGRLAGVAFLVARTAAAAAGRRVRRLRAAVGSRCRPRSP